MMQITGHDAIADRFRQAIARDRLASTFLFVGPPGIGKRSFAQFLAQTLLCDQAPPALLRPCGHCPACVQVQAGSHPDLHVVGKPADKNQLPLELLIGDDKHRMRAGLCYDISLRPFSGKRKIAIIDDADFLNEEGANCLLKTLEEPAKGSVLILIGTSEQRQLPTIRSRCQIVRFAPLTEDQVAALLRSQQICRDDQAAHRAAALSGGSLERAVAWSDEQFLEFREELLGRLADREFELLATAKRVVAFVEAAGKEAATKRDRMKEVLAMCGDFYRALLRAMSGGEWNGDEALVRAVAQTVRWWRGGPESAAACLDACLLAQSHVESNAAMPSLTEWWLDELGQLARGG